LLCLPEDVTHLADRRQLVHRRRAEMSLLSGIFHSTGQRDLRWSRPWSHRTEQYRHDDFAYLIVTQPHRQCPNRDEAQRKHLHQFVAVLITHDGRSRKMADGGCDTALAKAPSIRFWHEDVRDSHDARCEVGDGTCNDESVAPSGNDMDVLVIKQRW